jgi:hypothetical protein
LAENEFTDPYIPRIVSPEWAALLVVDVQKPRPILLRKVCCQHDWVATARLPDRSGKRR